MKFGFFGNTNNYPFSLARALVAQGHEVRFVVDRTYGLHRPEMRFPDLTAAYPEWLLDASPMTAKDIVLPTRRHRLVKRWLADCDVLVLNQYGPALFSRDRRPRIVILAGSDFHLCGETDYFAASRGAALPAPLVAMFRKMLVARQRAGIACAELIDYVWPGILDSDDLLFAQLGVEDTRRTSFLLVNLEICTYCPPPENSTLRLVSGTRLNWEVPDAAGKKNQLDSKHADTMLRGVAEFIRQTGIPLDIRLAKKGSHVRESQQLAADLGLAPFITWMDELSQAQVLDEFRAADIVVEQFNPRSCLGMAGRDAMAIGRPLIGYANTALLESMYSSPIPVCEASTPGELCDWLKRLAASRDLRERIGRDARRFAERFFSAEHAATTCMNALRRLNG